MDHHFVTSAVMICAGYVYRTLPGERHELDNGKKITIMKQSGSPLCRQLMQVADNEVTTLGTTSLSERQALLRNIFLPLRTRKVYLRNKLGVRSVPTSDSTQIGKGVLVVEYSGPRWHPKMAAA